MLSQTPGWPSRAARVASLPLHHVAATLAPARPQIQELGWLPRRCRAGSGSRGLPRNPATGPVCRTRSQRPCSSPVLSRSQHGDPSPACTLVAERSGPSEASSPRGFDPLPHSPADLGPRRGRPTARGDAAATPAGRGGEPGPRGYLLHPGSSKPQRATGRTNPYLPRPPCCTAPRACRSGHHRDYHRRLPPPRSRQAAPLGPAHSRTAPCVPRRGAGRRGTVRGRDVRRARVVGSIPIGWLGGTTARAPQDSSLPWRSRLEVRASGHHLERVGVARSAACWRIPGLILALLAGHSA